MIRRLAVVAAVVAALVAAGLWMSRFPTFGLFFGWPLGGTWSNAIEQAEGGVAVAIAGYLARDHIGRKLAAWWAKHHGPYAIEQHREALRQHEEARGSK